MYLYTLQESDIGHFTLSAGGRAYWIAGIFGRVQSGDVGKRVYVNNGVLQFESDAQRDKRLAKGR
jgi:hypothetical protein